MTPGREGEPPTRRPGSPITEVTVSAEIAASPEQLYEAISDPRNMSRWSPESTGAVAPRKGSLRVGDRFRGRNRIWFPWSTACRVVAADRPRQFAFDVLFAGRPAARWMYEIEALNNGNSRVTETWHDLRRGGIGRFLKVAALLLGRGLDAASRNRTTMEATLQAMSADMGARS